MKRSAIACVVLCLVGLAGGGGFAASEHAGRVTVGGVPVPGATITASQGDRKIVTSTDQQGGYRFADLVDGVWTIRVEMIGFAPAAQDVTVAPDSPPSVWEIKLRPFEDIAREIPARPAAPTRAETVRLKPDTTGNKKPDTR